MAIDLLRFNPTLVRLRPTAPTAVWDSQLRFQSHAGSIEALDRGADVLGPIVFQSHAGSIEAFWILGLLRPGGRVSIPRWFD